VESMGKKKASSKARFSLFFEDAYAGFLMER
jgi:hypothetical protein